MKRVAGLTFLTCLLAACSPPAPAPNHFAPLGQQDVTFFGAGKVARYQQQMDSTLELLEPLFFAEIFIAAGGEVSDASVTFPPPVSETYTLDYRYSESDAIGDVMYLSGMAPDFETLEARYPSGPYSFSFSTPHGNVENSVVTFSGRSFPRQPVIIFEQRGETIGFEDVDPHADLVITWPPFAEGRADENGILDDLIFVAIDSCTVEDIVHSGRPFERDDYLTFRASEYVVPANTLAPGQSYQMYVEHAILPHTQDEHGMPAFTTFAASTYMDFKTRGATDPAYCTAAAD